MIEEILQKKEDSPLRPLSWIIDARWYYTSFAFLLGIISQDSYALSFAPHILIFLLMMTFICNGAFMLLIKKEGETISPAHLTILRLGQIGIDLVFFFIILLITGGGAGSAVQSFFFIPIIASVFLFGARGAVAVSGISSFLLIFSVLVHENIFSQLLFLPHIVFIDPSLYLILIQTGVVILIYLLGGFFLAHIARTLETKNSTLAFEVKKETARVRRLEGIAKEFDESVKLLVRRDHELSLTNEKLVEVDKSKSEIISVAAHQLRTPLSALKWALKLLIDEDAGKISLEQRELLHKGMESNERLITLVNDILAMDHIESGRLKYTFIPVQLEDMIQGTIGELLLVASRRQVRVEFVPPRSFMPKVKVDPDKIRDVIQNLIENAIKYTKEGDTVLVTLTQEQNALVCAIADHGMGIPDEQQQKIFSRFFRAQNVIRAEIEGSGLGLYIAQNVVKRHGGRLWFESRVNVGTTFFLSLPLS